MPRSPAKPHLLAALLPLLATACLYAQHPTELQTLLPLRPGTTLPVELQHGLRAGKNPVGTPVIAKTTQRVPITRDLYLKRGAELLGDVTSSSAGGTASSTGTSQPGTLTLRFTSLRYRHQTLPIRTVAIAIANFTDVADTFAPANGSTDRGNPNPASWTTRQVGGDEVYRSGWSGDVLNEVMQKVGSADFHGVYRDPPQPPPSNTPSNTPDFPLALGVFSSSAAGLYGVDPGMTLHSADGVITLVGPPNKVLLRAGDDLLLEVIAPPALPK